MLRHRAARALLERLTTDHRRLHTLRTITTLAIQLVTFGLVLLVIFGAPNQGPTILGRLAVPQVASPSSSRTSSIAFFGWFILMGKNGILASATGSRDQRRRRRGRRDRPLLRTALLETGNCTDSRAIPQAAASPSSITFAITGQYFNFSTSGQWMWDEITVNIPPGASTPTRRSKPFTTPWLKRNRKGRQPR